MGMKRQSNIQRIFNNPCSHFTFHDMVETTFSLSVQTYGVFLQVQPGVTEISKTKENLTSTILPKCLHPHLSITLIAYVFDIMLSHLHISSWVFSQRMWPQSLRQPLHRFLQKVIQWKPQKYYQKLPI